MLGAFSSRACPRTSRAPSAGRSRASAAVGPWRVVGGRSTARRPPARLSHELERPVRLRTGGRGGSGAWGGSIRTHRRSTPHLQSAVWVQAYKRRTASRDPLDSIPQGRAFASRRDRRQGGRDSSSLSSSQHLATSQPHRTVTPPSTMALTMDTRRRDTSRGEALRATAPAGRTPLIPASVPAPKWKLLRSCPLCPAQPREVRDGARRTASRHRGAHSSSSCASGAPRCAGVARVGAAAGHGGRREPAPSRQVLAACPSLCRGSRRPCQPVAAGRRSPQQRGLQPERPTPPCRACRCCGDAGGPCRSGAGARPWNGGERA